MKKVNPFLALALFVAICAPEQSATAQSVKKQISREQSKALALKQQRAKPSDLAPFRDVPIPSGMARIILEAHDVWGDGSGYQLLMDADHTAYGNEIPPNTPLGQTLTEDCNIPADLYVPFEFKVPADADPSCTPEHQVVDGMSSVDIPAGAYDYVVVNPTPGLCIVIPGVFGQEDATYGNDFTFEAGKTYHFQALYYDGPSWQTSGDYVTLTITGEGTDLSEVTTVKPYTMAIVGNKIMATCNGHIALYDMNGRYVVGGIDKLEYTVPMGSYVIRLSINGRTYLEKIAVSDQ